MTVALVMPVVLAACGGGPAPLPVIQVTLTQRTVTVHIRAEVAATAPDRERGLMSRIFLASGDGMLFLFPAPVSGGFWMKDTLIPLDIAFISGTKVVEVDTMQPCRKDPCPLTTPASAYDSALEANSGALGRAGISAGAVVSLGASPPPAS